MAAVSVELRDMLGIMVTRLNNKQQQVLVAMRLSLVYDALTVMAAAIVPVIRTWLAYSRPFLRRTWAERTSIGSCCLNLVELRAGVLHVKKNKFLQQKILDGGQIMDSFKGTILDAEELKIRSTFRFPRRIAVTRTANQPRDPPTPGRLRSLPSIL